MQPFLRREERECHGTREVCHQPPLPENAYSPCARIFVVCILSGTRQREDLPCVYKKTHGKQQTRGNHALRRVPSTSTRRMWCFAMCQPAGTRRTWITWLARGFCRQGPHGRHCLPCVAHGELLSSMCAIGLAHGERYSAVRRPSGGLTDVIICRVSRVPAVSPCRYRHPWLPRRHVLYFAVCRPKHTAKFFAVCPIKDTQRSRLCRQGWSPSRLRRGPRTAN